MEAGCQVWQVTMVLSMGKVGTHIQGVLEKNCQIKPWKIFEKMQFNFMNVKIGLFLLVLNLSFPLNQVY